MYYKYDKFLIKTLVEKLDLYNLIILLKIVFYSNPEIRGEETSLLAINIKEPHVIKNLLIQTNIIVRPNLKYIRDLIKVIFGVDNF